MPKARIFRPVNWDRILNYEPDDFDYPELMDESVVLRIDKLSEMLPVKPQIISDYRPPTEGAKSQHNFGRAIDFVVSGVDSVQVLRVIAESMFFSGYGFYTNEKGAESFHVDTRRDRTPQNPATWGAWKDRQAGVFDWQYVGLSDIVKKVAGGGGLVAIVLLGITLYILLNK